MKQLYRQSFRWLMEELRVERLEFEFFKNFKWDEHCETKRGQSLIEMYLASVSVHGGKYP